MSRGRRIGRAAAVAAALATALALVLLMASSAHAEPLITSFSAGVLHDENVAKPEPSDYATQAGSHPDVAFTKFTLNTSLGSAERVRVDLPPGLTVDPQAIPRCSASGTTLGTCAASTRVGTATVTVANVPILGKQTVSGAVYNMTPPEGAPGDFAFEVTVGALFTIRTDLVGGLRWYPSGGRPGDFGQYFTISGISNLLGTALEKSELVFWGAPEEHNGGGATDNAFLTNPTSCAGPQTTYMSARTYSANEGSTSYTTPVGSEGCASVPFAPTISLTPATTQRDKPDGPTLDLHVPQDLAPAHIAPAHVAQAALTLPAGMTIDPSAGNGLQACTDAQFGAGTNAKIACPAASIVGTAEVATPLLGAPLTGSVYVGQPVEGSEYRLFLDAENAIAGVGVRLVGTVSADHETGRLTATFANTPQVPFTDMKLAFHAGAAALLANPLQCGAAETTGALSPWSGNAAAAPTSSFAVDADGAGGSCGAGSAFAPFASSAPSSTVAGAQTGLTLGVMRADGESTLGAVEATLPEGLVANLSTVTLCGEPAAAAGTCPESSRIGTVAVSAGAGTAPLALGGPVYLTGPHDGAQFGLSIAVPAVAGPYELGTVVARAAVKLDTVHGRISITSDPLPTIVGGVPLRLRSLKVTVERPSFLQNPASCAPTAIAGTVSSTASQSAPWSSPVTFGGCESLGFAPTLTATPTTTARDSATGLTLTLKLPPGSADVHTARLLMPAGLTLNPAVAGGLTACTDAEFGVGGQSPITCPASSALGTVTIHTPLLASPLQGSVYAGTPLSTEPASGREYRMFLDAENLADGISVRLVGDIAADPAAGRLTVDFGQTPALPFSELQVTLPAGPRTALASPAECGEARFEGALAASTGASAAPMGSYTVDGNGSGAPCPAQPAFAPAQSAGDEPGGAFAISLSRGEGQQYLSGVATKLPVGLLGRLAQVPLCPDAAAAAGACPSSSLIGSLAVAAGDGTAPLSLPGSVYLTGPYAGAPFGLAFVVPASAVGPYDLGTIVTRARIEVDERTARVTITSDALPQIIGGVPLRLRSLNVTVDRAGFLLRPTSCAPGTTESALTSTLSTAVDLASPYGNPACGSLPFDPSLSGETAVQPSRALGAGLTVTLAYPGEGRANLASVTASLPPQLAARLSTLQQACPEATFAASPSDCPPAADVGRASVQTPVLPDPLGGPAYLVSHGGAAFPDLDLVLQGDGVRLLLTGRTNISGAITTTTFQGLPDAPLSRFTLTLPAGAGSLLAVAGPLCEGALAMPTTMLAQNGARVTEQAPISVAGCAPSASTGHASLHVAPASFRAARSGASIAAAPFLARSRRGRARRERPSGASVTYSDPVAGVSVFTVMRPARGVLQGRRCLPPPRRRAAHGRRARACTRWVAMGSFTHRDVAGPDTFHFTGRVRGRALPPGGYRLSARLRPSAGAAPEEVWASFRISR